MKAKGERKLETMWFLHHYKDFANILLKSTHSTEGKCHSCFSITLGLQSGNKKSHFLKVPFSILSLATKDRLNAENEDLKKKHKSVSDEKETLSQQLKELEMRIKVLNSQYEGKITRLEKELQDAQVEKEQKGKAAEDTRKLLEEYQHKQKL